MSHHTRSQCRSIFSALALLLFASAASACTNQWAWKVDGVYQGTSKVLNGPQQVYSSKQQAKDAMDAMLATISNAKLNRETMSTMTDDVVWYLYDTRPVDFLFTPWQYNVGDGSSEESAMAAILSSWKLSCGTGTNWSVSLTSPYQPFVKQLYEQTRPCKCQQLIQ